MRDSSIRALSWIKRGSKTPRGERELALITIDQITVTTLALLGILLNSQAFFSHNPTAYWQFIFAFLTFVCWLYGTFKVKATGSQYAFLPLIIIFLVTPFACQPWVTHSWTSYGLIVVAAAVYVSAFPSRFTAFASILICAAAQVLSVVFKLTALTDIGDLSYAGTYFSSTWVLLVGTMLVIIRGQYLSLCDDIDLQLEELEERARVRSRNIRLLNSQDSQNLKMHGTVLNTLLVIKRNLEEQVDYLQALKRLKIEIRALESVDSSLRLGLERRIINESESSAGEKIVVNLTEFSLPDLDAVIEKQIEEIYREMLVNFSRHTQASKVEISMIGRKNGMCELIFAENSPEVMTKNWNEVEMISALKSKTMDRLIRGVNGDWKAELKGGQLVHSVVFASQPFGQDPTNEIKKLRGASFDLIRGSFPLISIFYGVILLPAVIYLHQLTLTNILLALSILCASIAFKLRANSRLRLPISLIASCLGLLVMPFAERQITQCAELQDIPWIFNGLLAPILLVSVVTTKIFLKWIPLILFTAEASLSIGIFPKACHQILQGSTPGLILIGASALLIGIAKNRAHNRDYSTSLSARNQSVEFDLVDVQLADSRGLLLESLGKLSSRLDLQNSIRSEMLNCVTLEIQKIRAFLLCSEYFELNCMRVLNTAIGNRIDMGHATKLALNNSEVFRDFDEELVQFFSIIFEESMFGSLEITMLGAVIPEVHLQTDSQTAARIQARIAKEPAVIKLVLTTKTVL